MRRSVVSAVLLALTTFLASVLVATGAQAATINYVALGDSYSSGTGASSSYLDSTCQRSSSAYPYLYAAQAAVASFSFQACSGATTGTVLSGQLSALGSGTTLVSITVGGNDVGFSSVMTDCVLYSTDTCTSSINTAKSKMTATLPGLLANVYTQIRAKAPNAKVVVLGYPVFYDLTNTLCVGLNSTKRTNLNAAAVLLNSTISAAVSGRSNFVFKSVVGVFATHQLCGSSANWLHSLTWPIDSSYHPNADGHSGGYLPTLKSGI